MPDISAISAALQSLATASDIAKQIRSAAKTLEDAQIRLQIADLTDALADVKTALADVKEENTRLREELSGFKKKFDYRTLIELRDNVYWSKNEEILGYGKGPWCSRCFDTKGVLINLHHKVASAIATGSASFASYKWECPNCKASVRAPKSNA